MRELCLERAHVANAMTSIEALKVVDKLLEETSLDAGAYAIAGRSPTFGVLCTSGRVCGFTVEGTTKRLPAAVMELETSEDLLVPMDVPQMNRATALVLAIARNNS